MIVPYVSEMDEVSPSSGVNEDQIELSAYTSSYASHTHSVNTSYVHTYTTSNTIGYPLICAGSMYVSGKWVPVEPIAINAPIVNSKTIDGLTQEECCARWEDNMRNDRRHVLTPRQKTIASDEWSRRLSNLVLDTEYKEKTRVLVDIDID